MRSSCIVFVFVFFNTLHGQHYPSGMDLVQRAQSKYFQQQYEQVNAAWHLVAPRQLGQKMEQAEFYSLSAALRSNYPGVAKKQSLFQLDYPYSRKAATLPLDLAHFYFDNKKYGYALKWFRNVDERSINKPKKPRFNFNYGYTLFAVKNYTTARKYLKRVQDHPEYESDAHYYLGHIAYQLDEYESASSSFSKVTKNQQQEDLGYFQVAMNFKLGRFEEAIKRGEQELKKAKGSLASDVSKIVGESYFNTNKYAAALPYLEAYEGKDGKWQNVDYYQLGFTYHHLKQYQKALAQFNKIIAAKDALAQNAYYLLADCYLKLNKTTEALNALRSAAAMDFDAQIKQDAFLQYAKLSYENGNPYENPTAVLLRFLEGYPDHEETSLLQELLVSSYTSSRNYKAALEVLQSEKEYKNPEMLQRVAFLYGMQWYRLGDYKAALPHLETAAKMKNQAVIAVNARYWLAQSYYELGDYAAALSHFETLTSKLGSKVEALQNLYYQIAYCQFQLKDYAPALEAFELQLAQKPALSKAYQRDIHLRMVDAHFALKAYWPAMEAYNKAIVLTPENAFYAQYQKGISYGFVDRNSQKIETLKALAAQTQIRNTYVDDALFELANTYASEKLLDNAIATYNTLIIEHTNSPFIPRALLNKGLINYNQERLQEAKQQLQTVVTRFKLDNVAQQAITTLKEIAIEEGSVEAFAQWLNTQGIQSISESELALSAFEAAEKQYLDRKTRSAKKLLEEFVVRYPESPNLKTAQFYLGELYYQDQDWENAATAYQTLISGPTTNYKEKALVKAAMARVNANQLEEAFPLWLQLDSIAGVEENKRYAKFNLMQAYYNRQEFLKALNVAKKVIALEQLDPKVQWDAQSIVAHAAMALGDTLTAAPAFAQLEKAPNGPMAAEALLFKARLQAQARDYEASNFTIAFISKQHSNAGEWGAKSLLLMAENFYALDDPFQAVFILDTIIENFNRYPEVQEKAKRLKARYEAAEEQTEQQQNTSEKPTKNAL